MFTIFFLQLFSDLNSEESQNLVKRQSIHPKEHVHIDGLNEKAEFLRNMRSTHSDHQSPQMLHLPDHVLRNHTKVLEESCFKDIRAEFQSEIFLRQTMNTTIKRLKELNYLEINANVSNKLLSLLDVDVELPRTFNDEKLLLDTRVAVLNLYLKAKLNMTNEEFGRIWQMYRAQLEIRSIELMVNVIDFLQNQLNFRDQKIIKNFFLVSTNAESISHLITEIPEIAGVPMKELLRQRPGLALQSANSIKKIIAHIESFNFQEDRILECIGVLLMNENTVHELLTALTLNEKLKPFLNHPKVLNLITNYNRVTRRLERNKDVGVTTPSFDVLTSPTRVYEKLQQRIVKKHKMVKPEKPDLKAIPKPLVDFYKKLLKSSSRDIRIMLAYNPKLCLEFVSRNEVELAVDFLHEMGFNNQEILESPAVLKLTQSQLKNRKRVLEECCFENFTMDHFTSFVSLMNKEIKTLKESNFLSETLNLPKHLIRFLDVELVLPEGISDEMTLRDLRGVIITLYLKEKLGINDQELKHLAENYLWLRRKSLRSLVEVIEISKHKLGLSNKQIIQTQTFLCACPDNLNKIIEEFPTIAGVPLREILLKDPTIVLSTPFEIKAIVGNIKSFNVNEKGIQKCPNLLAFKPSTVQFRLAEMAKQKECEVLIKMPNYLKLIRAYNDVKWRLETMKELNTQLVSINVLTQALDKFKKYVKNGVNVTLGYDASIYISDALKLDEIYVRGIFSRHPHWLQTPIVSVKATFDFLRANNFTDKDIQENLFLLLYPVSRVEHYLKHEHIEMVDKCKLTNSKRLNLCLYLIERDFHFSGDGVWEQNQADQNQDVCLREISEFPQKSNRLNSKINRKRKAKAAREL